MSCSRFYKIFLPYFSPFSFVKVSVKTFQPRASSSKRAAWARTRSPAYRARQDSSYLSVEDQFPLSFQQPPRSRRSSRPLTPLSRSVSPTSRAAGHYRSASPISLGAGLREVTAEAGDMEPHLMVGVITPCHTALITLSPCNLVTDHPVTLSHCTGHPVTLLLITLSHWSPCNLVTDPPVTLVTMHCRHPGTPGRHYPPCVLLKGFLKIPLWLNRGRYGVPNVKKCYLTGLFISVSGLHYPDELFGSERSSRCYNVRLAQSAQSTSF